MLTLTRKEGESIVIGKKGEIKITIVKIRDDKAQIGIIASKNLPVHREEIFKAIREAEKKSVKDRMFHTFIV